jgi:hypothetical protein
MYLVSVGFCLYQRECLCHLYLFSKSTDFVSKQQNESLRFCINERIFEEICHDLLFYLVLNFGPGNGRSKSDLYVVLFGNFTVWILPPNLYKLPTDLF